MKIKWALKEKKIREERKDSDSAKGYKRSIKTESGKKKIRMRKEECVENIGKYLSFFIKESNIKSAYFSRHTYDFTCV